MKTWMSLLVMCSLGLSSALFAADSDEEGALESRLYLNPSQIELQESVILVHLGDAVVETDTLAVDQGGIYLEKSHVRCPQCRRTGKLNLKNICGIAH